MEEENFSIFLWSLIFPVFKKRPKSQFYSFDIDVAASFFRSGNTCTTLSRRPSGSSSSTGVRSSAVPSHPEPLRDSSIRSRENLVVSNQEIRQLFDTIKELGDIVKLQNAKLDRLRWRPNYRLCDANSIANLSRPRRRISTVACSKATKGLCIFLFHHCSYRRFLLSFDSGLGSIVSLWDIIPSLVILKEASVFFFVMWWGGGAALKIASVYEVLRMSDIICQ